MPESRNRPGHLHQKKADIPSKQRVKGRAIWAILFAVFGFLIALFAAGENYVVLGIVTAISTITGYVIGKNMEKNAAHKV
ncbi:MAG TPA: hypothetical protein VF609_09320 [Flavisolibacter sp.]|jgi:hypothetical protein